MACSLGASATEGFIVTKATITKITSTSMNSEIYRVYYENGVDDFCNGHVRFFQAKANSERIFDRTFTLATSAMLSGSKVSIYSYADREDCDSAVAIEVLK